MRKRDARIQTGRGAEEEIKKKRIDGKTCEETSVAAGEKERTEGRKRRENAGSCSWLLGPRS